MTEHLVEIRMDLLPSRERDQGPGLFPGLHLLAWGGAAVNFPPLLIVGGDVVASCYVNFHRLESFYGKSTLTRLVFSQS